MVSTLTKSDIQFDSLSLFRQLTDGEYVWYVIVGYTLTTVEGEDINRDIRIGLAPAQITVAAKFLSNIRDQIKAEEGM